MPMLSWNDVSVRSTLRARPCLLGFRLWKKPLNPTAPPPISFASPMEREYKDLPTGIELSMAPSLRMTSNAWR
uniref:AGO901 n=1 Tax=Arundo donax TaxID=35708 RepID=A0A0A9F0K5_ARUDO